MNFKAAPAAMMLSPAMANSGAAAAFAANPMTIKATGNTTPTAKNHGL